MSPKSHNVPMDNKLLISAVVPIFNTPEKNLKECIDSIIHQTYENFELILVDDGSEAYLASLCDDYAASDSGGSAARNTGIKNATGDILTFVDSDDSLKSEAWALSIDALEKYNADCVAFGWTDYCELDTYIQKITDEITVIDSHKFQVEVGSDNYKCGGGYPWNKLWRMESLTKGGESIPEFDLNLNTFNPQLNMYEDKLWVLQAANNIDTVVLLPELLYNYTFVASSITQTEEQRIPRLLVAYDAYKIILDYLENVNDEAYVMAYNFCFEFTNNDIRFLSENKAKHKDQIKKSKRALKRLCKRIRPRTLYVPIWSRDFFIWFVYHYF